MINDFVGYIVQNTLFSDLKNVTCQIIPFCFFVLTDVSNVMFIKRKYCQALEKGINLKL